MIEERELEGPYSYEMYNGISKRSQKKYFNQLSAQVLLLLLIALLSSIPSLSEKYGNTKYAIDLILIILVFSIMIYQYFSDCVKDWQNSRYLAETILSKAWLFVWKCEPFKGDDKKSRLNFIDLVRNLEGQIEVKDFKSCLENQKGKISERGVSDWMNEFRIASVVDKKNNYLKYRLEDQMRWYKNKASFNQKRSNQCFIAGLILMGMGAALTIGIMLDKLPDWSYLGFFTTASASVSSYCQARRYDKLKITYGVSERELRGFKEKMNEITNENELIGLIENIEKAISREHKLWSEK